MKTQRITASYDNGDGLVIDVSIETPYADPMRLPNALAMTLYKALREVLPLAEGDAPDPAPSRHVPDPDCV